MLLIFQEAPALTETPNCRCKLGMGMTLGHMWHLFN